MTFVNLPLRYIDEHPAYLELFLTRGLNPELGFDARALETYPESWHRDTARTFHDAGLRCAVHLPFFDLHPGSLDPLIRRATRDRLLHAVDTARVYEPAHFIAHLGYNHLTYAQFEDQWMEHAVDTWRLILGRTGETPLFLENVFEHGPSRHAAVLTALHGRAGACLDLGHWHCFGKGRERGNLGDWLHALDPFPLHLHLHDNDGLAELHLGLGRGSIPWETLWDWLEKRKTPVTATFEPHTEEDFLATEAYLKARPNLPLA